MARFDKEPETLRYSVGQKVMGYHKSTGGGYFVAGEIIEVEQSDSLLSQNNYKIKGIENDIGGSLSEDEIIPFDQELFDRAYAEWRKWVKLYAEATDIYGKFRSMLAPRLQEQKEKLRELAEIDKELKRQKYMIDKK